MNKLQEQRLQLAEDVTTVIEFESDQGQTHDFVIDNVGDIPFENVWLSCGSCTSITSVEPNKIVGTFTPPQKWNLAVNEEDAIKKDGFIIKDYNKNVTVYADDGQTPHITTGGVYLGNHNKLAVGVQLKAKVRITE